MAEKKKKVAIIVSTVTQVTDKKDVEVAAVEKELCPDCGAPLFYTGHCGTCIVCGYSLCGG